MHRSAVTAGRSTPAVADRPGLTLKLLNSFELRDGAKRVLVASRAQRLLAFLAVQGNLTPRSVIAGSLWPEANGARAQASLRAAMFGVPRCAGPIIRGEGSSLAIDDLVSIDLQAAIELASTITDGRWAAEPRFHPDMALLSADLLPTWSDEWILIEQERFRQIRLHALEAMCMELIKRGDFAQAVTAGICAVSADPLRESAYRALIAVHLAEGNSVEAVRRFRTYARLLREELNIEPSARMISMLDEAIGSSVVGSVTQQ